MGLDPGHDQYHAFDPYRLEPGLQRESCFNMGRQARKGDMQDKVPAPNQTSLGFEQCLHNTTQRVYFLPFLGRQFLL